MKTYPLTQSQLGIFLEWIANPVMTQYNLPVVVVLQKTFDTRRLVDAINVLQEKRPELKLQFSLENGEPRQYFNPSLHIPVKLTSLSEAELPSYWEQIVKPYDLLGGMPLWRFEIIETEKQKYFFFECHHSASDGTALGTIFIPELNAILTGEELKPNEYTILNYAEDEVNLLKGDTYERAKAYYLDKFKDTNLLTLTQNGNDPWGNNIVRSVYVPMQIVDDWSKGHGTNSSCLFMAATGYVLSEYSRENKVSFSMATHGRMDKRIVSAYGMFVRSSPMLAAVDRKQKTIDFVCGFRREFMSSIRYGIYPFNHFCRDLNQKMAISFGFQGKGMKEDVVLGGDLCHVFQLPKGLTSSDLNITIYQTGDDYDIRMSASDKLYSVEFLDKMAEAIKTCVLNMMANPDAELGKIAIVSQEEQNKIIAMSKGNDLPYNHDETFVDMVVRQALEHPDAVAVVDADGKITYSELDALSNQLAHKLLQSGIQPNEFVGLMLPRRKEFEVAILGIQKAGGAYVPLDSEYPIDRLLYMLEDSEAKTLITTHALFEQKKQSGEFNIPNILFVEDLLVSGKEQEAVNHSNPEGLAYMIYTSGSTGKPKGVMLPHRALRAYLAWRIEELGFNESSRNIEHPSFSFDASLDDLLCPLAAGGQVHILPEALRKDLDGISQYIRENQINGLTLSTALGMAMLNQFSDLPLKYMMMGGEKMLPFPKTAVRVYNGYGPTEFSVCSSFHVVDQDKDVDIPIGRPVPNSYSFICDPAGNLMPAGVPGELCLCGKQMSLGYWHRPELTAEKFCDCPFLPGYKMYRTGDVACWNNEGELVFMGRIDNQVKIRGFRVEMGEIENAAKHFDSIKTVAAEVKTIGSTKQICLYYSADREIKGNELETYLSAELADYMVPTVYIQMDELPLTPNGKVNRKALPEPTIESGVEYVKPENETEEIIAETFGQILSYDKPVGALDNFFTLGGDSIKSIRLVSVLRTKGINLKVSDILQHKTVRDIAAIAGKADENKIDQSEVNGEIKPSAIQYSFIEMNLPKPEHFNQSVVLKSEKVDTETLNAALHAIVVHHDMLRAVLKDSTLYVRPSDEENLYELTEKELKTGDVNELMKQWADQLQESMDLAHGPLFKALLIHLEEMDVLLLCAHHLVVDGVSWRIIIEDLNNAYAQASTGASVTLPAKTHSFKYYTEQVSAYRDSYLLSVEKPYWKDVQEKMKGLKLSNGFDYDRHIERKEMVWSGDQVSQLLYKSSSVFNTNVNDLLLTALCRTYKLLTGNSSVSIQMEGHGRENLHTPILIDRTVGWFTSVYPVVFEGLTGDVRKDIILVKEISRRIPNKGLGYGILQYVPSAEGDQNLDKTLTPLIGFNYLGDLSESSDKAIFEIDSNLPSGRMLAKENAFGPSLMINCIANKEKFTAMFDYDSAVWSEEQMNRFVELLKEQLGYISDYLKEHNTTEHTASDFGATMWTEEEFETISAQFTSKGERIQLVYPMSPMQEAMLLKYQMEPESPAYRLITRFALNTLPTEAQLRYALDVVGAKHEVLRSNLIYKGVTEPCQAIIDRRLGLKMEDVSNEDDIDAAIVRIHQRELKEGFDLQNGALMRVVCIKTGKDSCELLFALHHAVVDGWCIPLYMSDFLHAMAEAMQGDTSRSTENIVTGRYAKFVHNLLRLDKKTALRYWKSSLDGYDTKAIVPTYGEEPTEEEKNCDSVNTRFTAEEAEQFKRLCSASGVTPNTVVELAWALVLQKYNRVNDVVFGKVVSGRDNTEDDVNDLVGIFINTIPERIQLKPEQTVLEALLQIQSNDAESNKYDFCALSEVQQQNGLGQDLFQSILVFENYPSDTNVLEAGLPFTVRPTATKEETFVELSVTAFTSEDGRLAIEMKYDNKLYTQAKINQALHSLITAIKGIMADTSVKVMSLPLMNSEDVAELTELFKGLHIEFDTNATFTSLFTEQARKTPDALAVADEDSEYTYAQLSDYSDTYAHLLIEKGIKPNTFVCVMLDRNKDFPLTVLAIHKAGAAYTPLDLEYPNERLSYMIENSESKIIITTHSVLEMKMAEGDLVLGDVQILYLDDLDLTVKSEPINLTTPDNLAYMIYTSGSTGLPKGVILHQRGLRSYIASMIDVLELTDKDRISNHRPFSFDAHIQDLYPVLTLGGSIHIMPSSIRKDMKGLRDFIVEHKITGGSYTTSLGAMLLDAYELPLRYLTCTGEKMIGLVSDKVQIYNGYGPTECTDLISAYKLDKGRVYKDIPIGRPMANSYCYIIDQNGCLQPRGIAGELCFASVQVGIGYWKLPEKTAEVFGDCPYLPAGEKPMRMYHTGDLCRWNNEGQLEYLGRIDSQVKLRGFRIELGEIETQASKVEGIKQAVAIVKDVIGVQHLILYYTVKEGMKVTPDEIRLFLESTKLAEYMIPEIYMELPEFPYNSSGKVNRKALPTPEIKVEDIVLPETQTEKDLFALVAEILKHDQFGVTTNLISVGMTSLSAMRLSALAQKKMQLDIKTKDLLTTPTIRAIAEKIDNGGVKKMASMRLSTGNAAQKSAKGSNPFQKRSNPLQKKNGNNPFLKRNDNK